MPSPPSTRPSGSTGRRSSAFVREDLGRARGSALLVDHRCRFGSWRSSRPSFAYVIWLVSRVINVETKIAEKLRAKLVEIANKRASRPYRFLFLARLRAGSARSSRRKKVTLDQSDFHALDGAVP